MSRTPRSEPVQQLACWIAADVRQDLRAFAGEHRIPQQLIVEEAVRRELARRRAAGAAPEVEQAPAAPASSGA